ncbi:MAG: Na+/H+ antiporter subunit E [Acidimicrobiales bacterium]
MSRLVRVVWLTTVWVALWSDLSVANVASGLLLACLIVVRFDTWRSGTTVLRPVAVARFAAYFLSQLVRSTFVVARTVISPRGRIRSDIVAFPLRGGSDAIVTLIANSISLTPGTLTLDVSTDPLTLYVHALDVRDTDALMDDLRTLETLALRAFGNADAALDDPRVARTSR